MSPMDANIVLNTRVKQKDSSQAVVIAVTASSIFDLEEEEGHEEDSTANENEPFKKGAAFPFLQALQRVNEALLERDAEETLLFDLILLSKHGSRGRIEDSAVHYGLEIGQFCFCELEDFAEPLQSNNVKLFLSTGRDDVCQAWESGVPAALLCPQGVSDSPGPLRVLFMGDVLGLSDHTAPLLRELGFSETQLLHVTAVKGAMADFAACLGQMSRKLQRDSSALCTYLMTAWSPRDASASALKTLRGWGLDVDQAFCLAGAPAGPVLAHMRPHILFDPRLRGPREGPARC